MATKQQKKKTPGKAPAVRPAARTKAKVRPAKPAAPKKTAARKPARAKPVAPTPAASPKPAAAAPARPAAKVLKLDAKTLNSLRDILIRLRDRLTGQINSLSNDSLKYVDDTSSEDRTDDFDRQFALNLVSTEHDALFEINGALRRIADSTYGRCDACGAAIEKVRLQALPFARMCLKCQSEQERGRQRFRPFGESIAQFTEPAAETEETETEEPGE